MNNLVARHAWYHSNLLQIRRLESKITKIQEEHDIKIKNILDEISLQKEQTKEILTNALSQFPSTNTNEQIQKSLHELFDGLHKLVEQMPKHALLSSIFSQINLFGIFAAITALFTGATMFGIMSFGLSFIASGAASEVMFNQKLRELTDKLTSHIDTLQRTKNEDWMSLNISFQNFQEKLQHFTTNN